MITLTLSPSFARFYDAQHREQYVVSFFGIKTHSEAARVVSALNCCEWYSGDIKRKFENEVLRRLNVL